MIFWGAFPCSDRVQDYQGIMGPRSARSSTGTLGSESSYRIQDPEQSEESHDTE